MRIKFHHVITISLIVFWGYLVYNFESAFLIYFNKDVWINMAIALGASIITVVGIVTSLFSSNENRRRIDLRDLYINMLKKLDEKIIRYDVPIFRPIYEHSKNTLDNLIAMITYIKYSDNLWGILSFFFYFFSVYYILLKLPLKYIIVLFIFGASFEIGYIMYLLNEFLNLDDIEAPLPLGDLGLTGLMVNGRSRPFGGVNNVYLFPSDEPIRSISLLLTFNGKARNGFLHAIIKYTNRMETHIPDSFTSLLDFGFVNDYTLAVYGGEDTGILQIDGHLDLLFPFNIRGERMYVTKMNVPYRGAVEIFQYCNAPQDFLVESIQIRLYEDPYYRPNINRRAVNMFEIQPIDGETFDQNFSIATEDPTERIS